MQSAELDFEVKRKLFHLSSLLIPLFYIFLSKLVAVIALTIITAIILYIDMSRHYNPKIQAFVDNIFFGIMRPKETSGSFVISGMSFFFMGTLIVIALFSKGLAITAISVLIFADAAAALVGVRFGKKLKNGKSLEGSTAFFAVSVLISLLCYFTIGYSTSFLVILIASIITTLAEFYASNWRINDNILIPLTYALSTFCLSFTL